MLKLVSKKQTDLSKLDIKKIISLKNTHWKYSFSEIYRFLKKNFKKNDFYNLIFLNQKLIGYTGFRNKYFFLKNKKLKYLHFDCLVILKKFRDKKISNILMCFNHYVIQDKSLPSILFCEKKMIKYYQNYNWKKINKNKIKLNIKNKKSKITLFFNLQSI